MAFWTYILRCADESYYVGHTDNLEQRIAQHGHGEIEGYTRTRRPIALVWSEYFSTRDEAFTVERQLKGWSRVKKEALIRGDWSSVRALASRSKLLRDAVSTSSTAPQDERREKVTIPSEERLSKGEDASRSPPLIILVRPQLGENIGKAARAMLNFGLSELRLVSPRDGWPNPSAGPAAAGADIVLDQAQVFESIAQATADCTHVYATSVRRRGVIKPVATPAEAALTIRNEAGRSAILFGPERAGLENDDIAIARTLIPVPVNPAFGSLNLAQAVILVAYEWSKGEALAQPSKIDLDPPAEQVELDGMIGQLDAMLEATGHFHPPDRAHIDRQMIRSIQTKPGWSAQEVRTLRGVLRSLGRRPEK